MPQTPRLSRWEVGVDLGLGTAINISFQATFLRTFTPYQGLSFAGVFLLLALARRYLVRRGFNRLSRPGKGQSRRISLLEVVTDTACATVIASGLLVLWYPAEPLPRISGLVVISYALTPVGRLVLRRFFERFPEAKSRGGHQME